MQVLEFGADVSDPLAPYLAVDRSSPRHECWVAGHMVAGLDGTAAVGGRVGELSTPPDQELFRRMRQVADVVLIGAETARREGYGPVRLSERAQAERRALGKPANPPIAVVSRSMEIDPASSLTVWNASSSHVTLFIMLAVTAVFLPIVLIYTAWVYKVLFGRITLRDVDTNPDFY